MAHPAMDHGPVISPNGSDLLEQKAQELLLQRLEQAQSPIPPQVVLELGRLEAVPIPATVMHEAVWNLVQQGRVEFTNDWRLQLAK